MTSILSGVHFWTEADRANPVPPSPGVTTIPYSALRMPSNWRRGNNWSLGTTQSPGKVSRESGYPRALADAAFQPSGGEIQIRGPQNARSFVTFSGICSFSELMQTRFLLELTVPCVILPIASLPR